MSNPKKYEPLPERLMSATPFERFAYRLGFSRCPDFRLHADWHRFEPEAATWRRRDK